MTNVSKIMNVAERKFKNPDHISVAQLAHEHGYDNTTDFIEEVCSTDSVVPACCQHGCQVEPDADGKCEHGCPSPLVALGYILIRLIRQK